MEEISTVVETAETGFTDEQVATMTQWAHEDGWLKDEAAPIAGQGVEPVTDAFGGLVSPDAYNFPAPPASLEAMTLDEQREIRTAMAEAGIPRELGEEAARRWNHALMQPQDEAALQLGMRQVEAQLRQTYGSDADEVIRLARKEAARIAKRVPAIREMIEQTQLGNDAWLIGTLANIARARKQNF